MVNVVESQREPLAKLKPLDHLERISPLLRQIFSIIDKIFSIDCRRFLAFLLRFPFFFFNLLCRVVQKEKDYRDSFCFCLLSTKNGEPSFLTDQKRGEVEKSRMSAKRYAKLYPPHLSSRENDIPPSSYLLFPSSIVFCPIQLSYRVSDTFSPSTFHLD